MDHQKATGLRREFHFKTDFYLAIQQNTLQQTSCFSDLKCVINVGIQGLQRSWIAQQAPGLQQNKQLSGQY